MCHAFRDESDVVAEAFEEDFGVPAIVGKAVAKLGAELVAHGRDLAAHLVTYGSYFAAQPVTHAGHLAAQRYIEALNTLTHSVERRDGFEIHDDIVASSHAPPRPPTESCAISDARRRMP